MAARFESAPDRPRRRLLRQRDAALHCGLQAAVLLGEPDVPLQDRLIDPVDLAPSLLVDLGGAGIAGPQFASTVAARLSSSSVRLTANGHHFDPAGRDPRAFSRVRREPAPMSGVASRSRDRDRRTRRRRARRPARPVAEAESSVEGPRPLPGRRAGAGSCDRSPALRRQPPPQPRSAASPPDPEVSAKAKRRRFTAACTSRPSSTTRASLAGSPTSKRQRTAAGGSSSGTTPSTGTAASACSRPNKSTAAAPPR